MKSSIRRTGLVTVFALALSSLPTTGLAAPISVPLTSAPVQVSSGNPLRDLVALIALETQALFSDLTVVYDDSFVETACDLPC